MRVGPAIRARPSHHLVRRWRIKRQEEGVRKGDVRAPMGLSNISLAAKPIPSASHCPSQPDQQTSTAVGTWNISALVCLLYIAWTRTDLVAADLS